MAGNPDDKGSFDDLKKSVESLGSPVEEILKAIGNMYDEADKLNNAFVAGRTRLDEMADAASKSAAGIIRLGGSISDVSTTIAGIAEGSRRNFIATEDQVSKIYAGATLLGTTSATLVENFAEGLRKACIGLSIAENEWRLHSKLHSALKQKSISEDPTNVSHIYVM